ncbi:hypothetical protein JCM24511_05605 [Saitozyma sp. JCM 24511]|nr:hypothetical protein JCM24511_05605 [Saitozyma sp. JCM 24511]
MSFRAAFPGLRGAAHNAFRTAGSSRAYTGTNAPPSSPSALRRWTVRFAIALAIPGAYFAGAVFPPKVVLMLYPRYSPPAPEASSKQGQDLMNAVEREMQELYHVAHLRSRGDEYYETRPYQKFDPNKIHNSLTAGSLRGPGRLAVPPLLFAKKDESEAIGIVHLGRALCGHDGIIHGGLISTVFDEALARIALLNLTSGIGVTANLNVNFRVPCMADQFVMVRTKLESVQGRKVKVSGTMETLDGEVVADATGLFVEPKWAQFLQSSGVTEALGRPIPAPKNTPALFDGQTERIV